MSLFRRALGRLLELRGRGKEDRRGGPEDLWILGAHVLNLAVHLAGKPLACSAAVMQDGRPVTPADVIRPEADFGLMAGNAAQARFGMEAGVPVFFDSVHEAGDPEVGFGLQLIGTNASPTSSLAPSRFPDARGKGRCGEVRSEHGIQADHGPRKDFGWRSSRGGRKEPWADYEQ